MTMYIYIHFIILANTQQRSIRNRVQLKQMRFIASTEC